MRKILTMFAALAVAFVFAFLSSASPSAFAAEKPEATKNVKVLIVGEPSAEYVADVIARIEARGVTVQFAEAEEPALELPDALTGLNKTLFETAYFDNSESVPIIQHVNRSERIQTINYKSPVERFFSGFDNPARGKI